MRISIPVKAGPSLDWHVLEGYDRSLFRHVGDRDLLLLFVGEVQAGIPQFQDHVATDWWYGYAEYGSMGLGATTHSSATDGPVQHWSRPKWVLEWKHTDAQARVHVLEEYEAEAMRFCGKFFQEVQQRPGEKLQWNMATPKERYIQKVHGLLDHIQRGDIYEINYCIRRNASSIRFDPYAAFGRLFEHAKANFAGFYRHGDRYALCLSPERFLAFEGDRVFSEPMKGTRPRSLDPLEDVRSREELAADPKERSENIMALDVARHDLSRIAASGSVQVEELCGVRPHAHVHQMTSRVAARIRKELSPMDVVEAAFPMASMTGAPKKMAMRLIAEAEDQERGLFSGTLGYFAPDGTGDLNVVIRTIFFDAATGGLHTITGSALTALCDPEKEWDECELKARSVIGML